MPTSETLSGYARAEADWYVEPREATRALLAAEHFAGTIMDPACGEGRIVFECWRAGLTAEGSDVVQRSPLWLQREFLTDCLLPRVDCVITNPPYRLLTPFIERALEVARWKVAIFCRLLSLEGETRLRDLYRQHPLARVYVFANRQPCPPGGIEVKDEKGKLAHCWQVYEHGHKGPPALHWLNTKEIT